MTVTMLSELADAMERFDRDKDTWVGIISGSARSFCAGRDVQMFRDRPEGQEGTTARRVGSPSLGDISSGKPVIGIVHGHVFGLGLMLAGECDILIATKDTGSA